MSGRPIGRAGAAGGFQLLGRRQFLGRAAQAAGLMTLAGLRVARAEGPGRLDPADPAAKTIGYAEDASRLDPAKEPLFKPGSRCSTCNFYQAQDAQGDTAPCTIFANRRVAAGGWCRAWAPKP